MQVFKISAKGQNTPSPSLILSTAPQVATLTSLESAKRLWAVTVWFKAHPYLAVEKERREREKERKKEAGRVGQLRIAKGSAVGAVTKVILAQGNAPLASRDYSSNGLNSGSPFHRKKLIIHI